MDFTTQLKTQIKQNKPNLSENSINLYIRNITKLNGNGTLKNLNFLKDTENILEKLEKYKDNTKRTYLISIVSCLTPVKDKFKKIHKIYYDKMVSKANEIESEPKGEKSETQKENWVSMDDIRNKREDLKKEIELFKDNKKISESEYEKLLQYLILSLYTLQSPRRNQDYLLMNVVKEYNEKMANDKNYLDLTNKKFVFLKHKTSAKYPSISIDINDELFQIINIYLKYHPLISGKITKNLDKPFLVTYESKILNNSNQITRILNKIFGKKIGSSMIRHIFVSDKFKDKLEDMKKTALEMGHTIETQQNDYIKN